MSRWSSRIVVLWLSGAALACGDGSVDDEISRGPERGPDGSPLPGARPPVPDGPAEGPSPMCEGYEPPTTQGLMFAPGEHAHMGLAPELGLAEFTLETWVRRDGRGTTANTGVGGLKLVPVITKGRGESDGSNLDCNYAFGFYGDVIAADFEDMESGANHPIYGKTPIPYGEWHHIAVSYDGSAWRLYVDGALDHTREAGAQPRFDSIQHFGLGAAFNSQGVAAGALHGALDEVRVYARALSGAEIASSMYSSTPSQDGLRAHYRLDSSEQAGAKVITDALGDFDGELVSADAPSYVTPGAPLGRGVAPRIANPKQRVLADTAELSVEVDDADGELEVEFFARELTEHDDFTVVVLPDSQYYTRNADPPSRPQADDPDYFYAQTRWTVENYAARNIVGLFHVGDIINNADVPAQWSRAVQAFSLLEAPLPGFPDGMPYGLSFGNHDQFPRNVAGATSEANSHFGRTRFAGRGYYGDTYNSTNDDNWVSFWAGGLRIVVVSMQFTEEPDPAVLAWARGVFESHPDAFGVVNSHYIVTSGGNFSPHGSAIYEALKDVPNVQLMASGHVSVDARLTREHEGNVIHAMLSDYQRCFPDPADPTKPLVGDQSRTNGGFGFLRTWRFSPKTSKLYVESYSPKENISYTDDRNQFELDIDLRGSGSSFVRVGRVQAEEGVARFSLPNVEPGKVYEWYAAAHDCTHRRSTEILRVEGQ